MKTIQSRTIYIKAVPKKPLIEDKILRCSHYLGKCKGNVPYEMTCNLFGRSVENGIKDTIQPDSFIVDHK